MNTRSLTISQRASRAPQRLVLLGIVFLGLLALTPAAVAADLPGLTVIGVAPDGTETVLVDAFQRQRLGDHRSAHPA